MPKITIDTAAPDMDAIKQVVLKQLRDNPSSKQVYTEGLYNYVQLVNRANDRREFDALVHEVFWELALAGVLVPGCGTQSNETGFPWYRLTAYGRRVLETAGYSPHHRTEFVGQLSARIPGADATVLAYLDESLQTFSSGNNVAAMVMLGVAAERVFDLLCDSLIKSLQNPTEKTKFEDLLGRFSMKPKVDWVHDKFQKMQKPPRPSGFPDNATLMVTGIYDIIRNQRNDLGHPRDQPPRTGAGEAHAALLVFAKYYESVESLRGWLSQNPV